MVVGGVADEPRALGDGVDQDAFHLDIAARRPRSIPRRCRAGARARAAGRARRRPRRSARPAGVRSPDRMSAPPGVRDQRRRHPLEDVGLDVGDDEIERARRPRRASRRRRRRGAMPFRSRFSRAALHRDRVDVDGDAARARPQLGRGDRRGCPTRCRRRGTARPPARPTRARRARAGTAASTHARRCRTRAPGRDRGRRRSAAGAYVSHDGTMTMRGATRDDVKVALPGVAPLVLGRRGRARAPPPGRR